MLKIIEIGGISPFGMSYSIDLRGHHTVVLYDRDFSKTTALCNILYLLRNFLMETDPERRTMHLSAVAQTILQNLCRVEGFSLSLEFSRPNKKDRVDVKYMVSVNGMNIPFESVSETENGKCKNTLSRAGDTYEESGEIHNRKIKNDVSILHYPFLETESVKYIKDQIGRFVFYHQRNEMYGEDIGKINTVLRSGKHQDKNKIVFCTNYYHRENRELFEDTLSTRKNSNRFCQLVVGTNVPYPERDTRLVESSANLSLEQCMSLKSCEPEVLGA